MPCAATRRRSPRTRPPSRTRPTPRAAAAGRAGAAHRHHAGARLRQQGALRRPRVRRGRPQRPDYEMRVDHDVCYSDIQHLWLGRDIDQHVFPYVNGSITPDGQAARRLGRVPGAHRAADLGRRAVRPRRRRVPALLGAADGPVRPAHRLDAGPAGALAGAGLGARPAAGALRVPQLGPAGGGLRGRRRVRGARLAHRPAAGRTGPRWPRCCSGWASRSSSTRGRSCCRWRCTC